MPLDEAVECPLCMEPLDMDDMNFFPCTCGYQICRFCWHRIRTDENSLCPACRKQYQEDPAEFKPLTDDELTRIKKERRQKDIQRKQKAAENRRHLANIRVVQKNLVFAVGLSNRLADVDVLKRQEYFGKFGKIVKVVINSSTSYAGAQGPSASAYITYTRPEDCLRAIQAVNNLYVDGRTLKASLGTTKYCSHFLKGTQCTKPDCMYLHELGDEVASFTKEDMQAGKHQDYEQRLVEQYLQPGTPTSGQQVPQPTSGGSSPGATTTAGTTAPVPQPLTQSTTANSKNTNGTTQRKKVDGDGAASGNPPDKESWPVLTSNKNNNQSGSSSPVITLQSPAASIGDTQDEQATEPDQQKNVTHNGLSASPPPSQQHTTQAPPPVPHNPATANIQNTHNGFNHSPQSTISGVRTPTPETDSPRLPSNLPTTDQGPLMAARKLPFTEDLASTSTSLFSGNSGFPAFRNGSHLHSNLPTQIPQQTHNRPPIGDFPSVNLLRDSDPSILAAANWQTNLGLTNMSLPSDDDLGFDPFVESNKGLADLIENESCSFGSLSVSSLNKPAPPPGVTVNGGTSGLLNGFSGINMSHMPPVSSLPVSSSSTPAPPPGLSGFHQYPTPSTADTPFRGSRMMGLMNLGQTSSAGLHHPQQNNRSSGGVGGFSDMGRMGLHNNHHMHEHNTGKGEHDIFHNQTNDMREGLKALLPNVPINFAPSSPVQAPHGSRLRNGYSNNSSASWNGLPGHNKPAHIEEQFMDPAIITGCIGGMEGTSASPPGSQPHWMKSIQQLTETESPVKQQQPSMLPAGYSQRGMPPSAHSRLPFTQSIPLSGNTNGWPSLQTHNPPPGFQQPFRSTQQNTHMTTPLESQ